MEQLVLPIGRAAPPSFDDFVVGRNAETIAALRAFAARTLPETGLLLWGEAGVGKTHLLQAAAGAAVAMAAPVAVFAEPGELLAADVDVLARQELVAVDRIDAATGPAQALLFTLYNRLREGGRRLLVAGRTPLAALRIREDLRTRLLGRRPRTAAAHRRREAGRAAGARPPAGVRPVSRGHRLPAGARPPRHAGAGGDAGGARPAVAVDQARDYCTHAERMVKPRAAPWSLMPGFAPVW
jgi:DnaA family protein